MSYIDCGIRYAIQAAIKSRAPHFRVGAALLKGGKVIRVGYNRFRKTCPCATNMFQTIHAEHDCLNGIPYETLRKSFLFVVRITPAGNLAMARPCSHCEKYIRQLPLRGVYFTNVTGEISFERYR